MRELKKPPSRLRLAEADAVTPQGLVAEWNSNAATIAFRIELTNWMMKSQDGYCAYCSLSVGERGRRSSAVEHFVAKGGRYGEPQWTFELKNLVLACEFCNSKLKKNTNTVIRPAPYCYDQAAFTLFHPYIDRLQEHIAGGYPGGCTDPKKVKGVSDAGKATVKLFKLKSADLRHLWQSERDAALKARKKKLRSNGEKARIEAARAEVVASLGAAF
jgi:uncharacterized protein (TIGR02646 family)